MPNSKLTRELIAATALGMLDEGEGLASLSMRKLGAQLGVEAMSLYHYVENKDDLLDAMLTNVYAMIELPGPGHWEVQLREAAQSFYDVLTTSRGVFELITRQPAVSADSLAVIFFGAKVFEAAGLSTSQAVSALHVSFAFVIGHVAVLEGSMASVLGHDSIDPSLLDNSEMRKFVTDIGHVTRQQQFQIGLEVVIGGLRSRYEELS